MRIVVCIKQVPLVEQIKFDPETRRLIREGVESEINPFDKRALAEALNLKKKFGAETVVITMGPPQAESALREALAMGIDRAVHLLGREFAGADTLATARALALAIRRIGFDLILCGKYSTDAETAQVPPMLAELLDIPQVTGVTRLEFDGHEFMATRELDDGFETLAGQAPALFTAAERLTKPLRVTPDDLERVKTVPIEVVKAQDLAPDVTQFGIEGSPTWVEAIHSIEPQRKRIIRRVNGNALQVVGETVDDLMREGLFGAREEQERREMIPATERHNRAKSIWTFAEIVEGMIRSVTFELLGRSVELAEQLNGEVAALVVGADVRRHADALAAYGADQVYVAETFDLTHYLVEPFAKIVADAIAAYKPFAVLFPSTANGRDLAPRVAARLGVGLTGDAIGLELDSEGRLVSLKPAFGGNIVAPILSRTLPVMTTVRPGMLAPMQPNPNRLAHIVDLPVGQVQSRVRWVSGEKSTDEGMALDNAEIIIGVGMGIGGPENLPLVRELARALDAPLGATRRVVDAGWLPRQLQIGLTGRAVAPRLYLALGVRGAFNHSVGIQRSGIILAVNSNPDAEIFKQCDYGLVGDWREVTEAMLRVLRERRATEA